MGKTTAHFFTTNPTTNSMKNKCPVCTKSKGRRDCLLNNNELICSSCCAEIRSEESCSDCTHFFLAMKQSIQKMKRNGFQEFNCLIDPVADKQVDKALALIEIKDLVNAKEQADILIEKHPDQYLAHYVMGCYCVTTNDIKGSIPHFKTSLKIFPYFAQAWYNLAQSHQRLVEIPEYINALNKVIEYGNDHAPFLADAKENLHSIGQMIQKQNGFTISEYLEQLQKYDFTFEKMENKNFEQAIEGFKQIIEKEPNHVQSHGNLGICYASIGDKKLALEYLDRSLELDPSYVIASNNKKLFLEMNEGEPIEVKMKSVKYHDGRDLLV